MPVTPQFPIDDLVERKLAELHRYGYILGGHNGPYYDDETPVRNTAHWITVFGHYFNRTKEKKYFDAVKTCGDYLISNEARPMKASFFCRHNTKKDHANGTIGTAWAIEGLVAAYKIVKDKKYIDVASDAFLQFPFDERYKLWKVIDTDGTVRKFDMTFNHQLWFSMAGIQLLKVIENHEIKKRCYMFLNNLQNSFSIYRNGLVKHHMFNSITIKDYLRTALIKCKSLKNFLIHRKTMRYKENGYHLFNIYAFATLEHAGVELDFFHSKKFEKALLYCFSNELFAWLEEKSINLDVNSMLKVKNNTINIYGYPYNAPGFELPYIYNAFRYRLPDKDIFVQNIVEKQKKLTLNDALASFNRSTEDENTLNARIYEYLKMYNQDIDC